jgi:GNAT superfamily N-acetyltransferase
MAGRVALPKRSTVGIVRIRLCWISPSPAPKETVGDLRSASQVMRVEETTYYLEMTEPGQLRAVQADGNHVAVRQVTAPCPEVNRFFYAAVGADWRWVDRLPWNLERWRQYVSQSDLETWLLYVAETPAGYFELKGQGGADIEIAYFGLLPQYVGRRLGGYLLTMAARRAWDKGASRVWLHTSSFDHPAALANYQARGFRLYRQERSPKDLPEDGSAAGTLADAC